MQKRVFGANLFHRTIVGGGSPFATQAALETFRPVYRWKNHDSPPVITSDKRHPPSVNLDKFSLHIRTRSLR